MRVTGVWSGPRDASLFGVWTLPDGDVARGAVVLCPPLGKEAVHAYRTMALAAQLLAERGVAVLRFDYRGTGDSTGAEFSPDAVENWRRDVVAAVEHARRVVPGGVALGGLRAGALCAALAAAECEPLLGLALWDPVVSGRAYLREQTVLYKMKVGADDDADGGVSLVGGVLHPGAADALKRVSIARATPVGREVPVLVAARSERADDAALGALVERGADQLTVTGLEKVFDVATFEIELPGPSTTAVADWLAARFGSERHAVSLPDRPSAIVSHDAAGADLTERVTRLGPNALFAVVTDPVGGAGVDAPLAVMLPSSTEHRVGTGRIWVDLARRLAAEGIRAVRFDRRGTGDSGAVVAGERTPAFSATAHEDLDDVLASFGAPSSATALIGHCSGAWLAGEAAAEGLAGSVVLLGASRFTVGRQITDYSPVDDPDRAEMAIRTRAGRTRAAVKPWIPSPAWRWLGRRDLVHAPELVLSRLRAAGVATTLVLAPVDHHHFLANRGGRVVEKLANRGWTVELHAGERGDHALVHRGLRTTSIDRTVTAVVRHLAVTG